MGKQVYAHICFCKITIQKHAVLDGNNMSDIQAEWKKCIEEEKRREEEEELEQDNDATTDTENDKSVLKVTTVKRLQIS